MDRWMEEWMEKMEESGCLVLKQPSQCQSHRHHHHGCRSKNSIDDDFYIYDFRRRK